MDITKDGTVLDGQVINDNINVRANDVTIRNCDIDAQYNLYGINNIFNDSDGKPFIGLKVINSKIHNARQSMFYARNVLVRKCQIFDGGGDGLKLHENSTVEYSTIYHLGKEIDEHQGEDGIQIRHGHNIIIRHNRFWLPKSHENIGYHSNAAIIAAAALGPLHDMEIYGNYLEGGNYTVYIINKEPDKFPNPYNIKLNNNLFGRDYNFGVLSADIGDNWDIDGNRWYDTNEWMEINNLDGDSD